MSARRDSVRIYQQRHRHLAPAVPADDVVLVYLEKYLCTPGQPADGAARLLDAGCGNGRYGRTLAAAGYGRVYGVDVFPVAAGGGVACVRGDVGRLPFAPGSFDCAYSISVLYHLERPDLAIREIARVTAAGGTFLMTAHTPHSLFTAFRRVWTRLGGLKYDNLRGVRFPGAGDYAAWLEAAGFRVLRIDGYSLLGVRERAKQARRLLHRLLPRAKWLERPWRTGVTRWRWLARLKSVLGYHMILVARKEASWRR